MDFFAKKTVLKTGSLFARIPVPVRRLGLFMATVATGIAVFHLCDRNPALHRLLPRCIFYEWTHWYCPGCGATRALRALLQGDFGNAFRQNLLFLPLLAMVVVLLWRPEWALQRKISYPIAAIVMLFLILRNLPWAPFCYLAPH